MSYAYAADAATIQAALTALSNIGVGNVSVTGGPLPGSTVTVEFTGMLSGVDVALMTASSSLTGGTSPSMLWQRWRPAASWVAPI